MKDYQKLKNNPPNPYPEWDKDGYLTFYYSNEINLDECIKNLEFLLELINKNIKSNNLPKAENFKKITDVNNDIGNPDFFKCKKFLRKLKIGGYQINGFLKFLNTIIETVNNAPSLKTSEQLSMSSEEKITRDYFSDEPHTNVDMTEEEREKLRKFLKRK